MKDHIGISNNTAKKIFFVLFLVYRNNSFRLSGKKNAEKLLFLFIKIKTTGISSLFDVTFSAVINFQKIIKSISGGFSRPPLNFAFLKFSENSNFDPICNKNINFMAWKQKKLVIFNYEITNFLKFIRAIRENYIYIEI